METRRLVMSDFNAATLALLRDDLAEAERIARGVLAKLGGRAETELGAWELATVAEAHLCLADESKALGWYRRAAAAARNRPQEIAVMRRQARLVYEKRERDASPLTTALPTPRVVAFSGHLTDAPGRAVPRFPDGETASKAGRAIREWLSARKASIHAVSAAARGGDILFLEAVLSLSGTATVLLPFPKSDFKKASVGHDWDQRFDDVLANERVDCPTPLFDSAPTEETELGKAFEKGNLAILDETERLARLFDDSEPYLLTLWNGSPGDGPGGTSHAVSSWTARGFPTANIDVSKL